MTAGAHDLDAIAALFRAAGVCDLGSTHVQSLTPEAWARRCVALGEPPAHVIRRLAIRKAGGNPLAPPPPPPRAKRREDHPVEVASRVLRDLEMLRRFSR